MKVYDCADEYELIVRFMQAEEFIKHPNYPALHEFALTGVLVAPRSILYWCLSGQFWSGAFDWDEYEKRVKESEGVKIFLAEKFGAEEVKRLEKKGDPFSDNS